MDQLTVHTDQTDQSDLDAAVRVAPEEVPAEALVEDVSIDGMCGVY